MEKKYKMVISVVITDETGAVPVGFSDTLQTYHNLNKAGVCYVEKNLLDAVAKMNADSAAAK